MKSTIINTIPHYIKDSHFEIPDAPPMSKQDEQEMSQKLQTLKQKAHDQNNQLYATPEKAQDVTNYLNYKETFTTKFSFIPTKIARQRLNQCQKGLKFNDLFQEGFIALMHAVDEHDFRKDSRFITYATKAVQWAIIKCLDDHNRTIRIPSHKIEQIYVTCAGMDDQQIAKHTNIDIQTIQAITKPTISLNTTINEDENLTNILEYSPTNNQHHAILREAIIEALTYINPRSAQMITQHYFHNLSLKEIADTHINENGTTGISKQRVKQIIEKGVKQLQESQDVINILKFAIYDIEKND